MYFAIQVAGFISILIPLLFCHFMLTPTRNRIVSAIVIGGACFITVALRFLLDFVPQMLGIHSVICYLLYFAVLVFLYRDKVWKRAVAWTMILFTTFGADILCYLLMDTIAPGISLYINSDSSYRLLGMVAAITVETLLWGMILPVWKRVQERQEMRVFIPLVVLPLGQTLEALAISRTFWNAEMDHSVFVLHFLSQIVLLAADVFWLYWIIGVSRREETEQQLQKAQNAIEAQQEYFRELEQSDAEIAKLRHDYNNQLSAIAVMLQMGKTEEAEALTKELSDTVQQTRRPVWCGSAVINALLSKKQTECEAAGVDFEAALNLPEKLPVSPMQLCSVFGNLIDNGIRGAAESVAEHKFLRVRAACRGGFLFVVTVNPAIEEKNLREGHGLGSIILKKIAEDAGGIYQTEYSGGEYRATVALKL